MKSLIIHGGCTFGISRVLVVVCYTIATCLQDLNIRGFVNRPNNAFVHWSIRNCYCSYHINFSVTTLALGSRPRQRHGKVWVDNAPWVSHSHGWKCKRVWGNEPTHSQVDSHFGSWSPYEVLNVLRVISRVTNHWIKDFLISLVSSWDIDV